MKGPPVLTPQTTRQSQPASPWLSKHLRTKRQLLTSDPGLLFILPQRHQPPLHCHLHCTTSRFPLHASQDASRVLLLYPDFPWAFFRIAALINIPCFFYSHHLGIHAQLSESHPCHPATLQPSPDFCVSQSMTQETPVGSDLGGNSFCSPIYTAVPPRRPPVPMLIFPTRHTRDLTATLHNSPFTSRCDQGLGQHKPVSCLFLHVPVTVTHPPAEGTLLHPALTHTCSQRRPANGWLHHPGLCHPSSVQWDPPACRRLGFWGPCQRDSPACLCPFG